MKDPKTVNDLFYNKYSETEIRNFIEKYPEQVDSSFWYRISYSQTLSEGFIRELQDEVDWYNISKYQNLSEQFLRDFQDKVYWLYISYYQTLSEAFIRDFQDKVDWNCISYSQTLSEPFLIEFINRVEIGNEELWGLIYNEKIPEDVKERIIDLKKILEN